MIDEKLEADMEEVLEIVVLGRSARNGASLNLKDVQFSNDVSAYIDYKFKPQLKTLGPKYGKQLGEIRTQLSQLDGHKAMGELNETGSLKLTLSSGEIALDKDDVLIESEQKEGFYTLSENGVTVAISTVLREAISHDVLADDIVLGENVGNEKDWDINGEKVSIGVKKN